MNEPANYDRLRSSIYMHIAKTSGTALAHSLISALAPTRTLTGFDQVMFGGFHDFGSFNPSVRNGIYTVDDRLPACADFVHGHFAFSTTKRAYPEAQFLTVFREPRVRLISLWLYWRTQTARTLESWGSWANVILRAQQPLVEFLNDPIVACQTDNMALRMLLWPHPLIPDKYFIPEDAYETLETMAAIQLENFAFVDVLENSQLWQNLSTWAGRPVNPVRLNGMVQGANISKQLIADALSQAAFTSLNARTRLDNLIWTKVCGLQMPGQDSREIAEHAFVQAVMRYAF